MLAVAKHLPYTPGSESGKLLNVDMLLPFCRANFSMLAVAKHLPYTPGSESGKLLNVEMLLSFCRANFSMFPCQLTIKNYSEQCLVILSGYRQTFYWHLFSSERCLLVIIYFPLQVRYMQEMKTNVWLRSLSKTYPRISKILQETSKPQTKTPLAPATPEQL